MKNSAKNKPFPIVGIGASAGGLEALCEFFTAMPTDKGLAFVVVVHLDPDHDSLLPELLQKQTAMPVVQIIDDVQIKVNTVYIIPPDKSLSVFNGRLQLVKMELPRFKHLPIDSFFRSLAQDQHANAIAIILSGTGSDGTQGIKEIKAETGLVLVQDENSAQYNGMPRSAIATGLVDYILPPKEMPNRIVAYTRFPNSTKEQAVSEQGQNDAILEKIYMLIRDHTGHDFSLYKRNTIYRRIERRMHLHQIENMLDYWLFLQKNAQEVIVLAKELLIGVTRFFRDAEAFDALQQDILPTWLAEKTDNETLRVWIAGCSTGEEAYSIAILLQECLDSVEQHLNIQVFGTDLDHASIEIARRGIYPAGISADVSSERLIRFFDQRDGFFKVKKSIREMVVFAPQNMIKDPPFTKLDMVCCRNVLIYFTAELQNKILPLFHYSLKENGILFLGSSESTGQSNSFFTITDKKWKIFSRNTIHDVDLRKMIKQPPRIEPSITSPTIMPNIIQKTEELSIMQLVEAILRQSSTPPCVIIDANKEILYIHGKLGKYIEPTQGKLSINIIDMIRSGLKAELIAAIRTVIKTKKKLQVKNCSFHHEGYPALVDLTVTPIGESSPMSNLLMVMFEELPVSESKPTEVLPASTKDIELLQRELNTTKENLQTTIEELETANEELKSTNEELQSTNEELQSTNEELETSKEELQSLNEESSTVNAELQCRIDDYQTINDDMKNLFDSTQVATIFLDTHLCIRRFTPKAKQIISLVFTDIGRPISHLTSSLLHTNLSELADHVLKTLEKHESEIYDAQKLCFLVRIVPYRTANNVIDGVVVTFENITDRKTIETALIASERRYKHLFDYCPLPMWVENLTPVAQALAVLRAEGVVDLSDYLNQHPEALEKLVSLIHIVQVNELTLSLFNSHNKNELAVVLSGLLNRLNNDGFVSKLLAIWNQQNKLQIHYVCHDSQGKPLDFIVDWTAPDDVDSIDYDDVIAIVSSSIKH